MAKLQLLGISGSLRATSFNSMLVREAARLFGPSDFTEGRIDMPLYDGDVEAEHGAPEAAQTLAAQIAAADAVILSTPEYNKGPSGALKNALDWVSRVPGQAWNGKPVAVMSAAAGRAGGERAQMVLRGFMVPFRPVVLSGPEIHLAECHNQFDDAGQLTGEVYLRDLGALMDGLRAAAEAR